YGVPPQAARSLSGSDLTVSTVSSGREDYLVVNHRRLPFSDRAVREATALGIDRAGLLTIGLSGQGAVATGMFPPDRGVQNVDMPMYSANMLVTGDPLYIFNQTLGKGGPANYGAYTNPQLESTLTALRSEADPAKRQALAVQAQQIVKEDTPNIYVLVVPF